MDPILFNVREYLGQTPKITDRLKIFALDDSTFSFLGGPRLTPEDLSRLLTNMSQSKPRAIIIDGLLSDTPTGNLSPLQEIPQKAPQVITGSYITPHKIRFREDLNIDTDPFQLSTYLDPSLDPLDLELPIDKRLDWYVYGHSKAYDGLFKAQGHITYNDDGTISPFYMLSPDTVLPHISLHSASSVFIGKKSLSINDVDIPLTATGRVIINHRPPLDFYNRTKSLRYLIERARDGVPEDQINEGDIVLILLAFATGNTDFHEGSPFGQIPGGLIIASMISNIDQNQWITPWEITPIAIIVMAIFGTILGIHASVSGFWLGLIGTPILYIGLSIYLFSYHAIQLEWFLPSSIFFINGLVYFAHNRLQDEIKLISMERNYYSEKALRLEEANKIAKLEGYLALGKAVQKLLLPKKMKGKIDNIIYQMLYQPHLKMAGDWFYIWDVSEDEKRFFIGDVMGKGPSAAIPVASIMSILKECEKRNLDMMSTLQLINNRLIELFDYHITTTVATASVHRDGRVDLVNCGSPGWFLYQSKGTQFIMMRSSPLGISETIQSVHQRIQLEHDQLLFTFTDGYIEGSRSIRRFMRNLDRDRNFLPNIEYINEKLQSISEIEQIEDDQSLITIQSA